MYIVLEVDLPTLIENLAINRDRKFNESINDIRKQLISDPEGDFFKILSDISTDEKLKLTRYYYDYGSNNDEIVLSLALDKRKKLKTMFQHNKSKINPLLLIQLPDARNLQDETLKKDVIDLLKTKYNITVQNNKLALWLNNEKTDNLRDISENDSEVEVLIFKHALALGWDCPRAQILLLFRDWKSYTFSIQTIGRIMRMPEPNKGHYLNNELNNGYVYTNLSDIIINVVSNDNDCQLRLI